MMDLIGIRDIEELTMCNLCKQTFNHTDLVPKLLACKHYFCLACIKSAMAKSQEVFCINCWKKTELPESTDPSILPTYNPALALAKNFSSIRDSVSSNSATSGILTNGSNSPDIKTVPENVYSRDVCPTHKVPFRLWCGTCNVNACHTCTSLPDYVHAGHQIISHSEATEKITSEIQAETMAVAKLVNELQRLVGQQRQFLLRVLEACITLKSHLESELQTSLVTVPELEDARNILNRTQSGITLIESPNEAQMIHSNLIVEKQRLQLKCQELYTQCHVNYLIKNSNTVFDFSLMKHVLENINTSDSVLNQQLAAQQNSPPVANPLLTLSNYCVSQMYAKHGKHPSSSQSSSSLYQAQPPPPPQFSPPIPSSMQIPPTPNGGLDYNSTSPPTMTPNTLLSLNTMMQQQQQHQHHKLQHPQQNQQQIQQPQQVQQYPPGLAAPQGSLPPFPVYYFNVEVNGMYYGRFLIQTRPDVAPKMSKNFEALTTGEMGYGYKGCLIFQCWEGESIITGDFEANNGRGGRSIYDEGYFVPDDTKFAAVRGAVGMRRSQKKHDSLGMVGSQFRIILSEMRGFTAIFAHVVEGLDLVESISKYGDPLGKPSKSIVISRCGKL